MTYSEPLARAIPFTTDNDYATGIGCDSLYDDEVHQGTVISISIPFYERDLLKEMDLQARMQCCSSRSQYIRRLVKKGRSERLKAVRNLGELSRQSGRQS